MLKIQNIAVLTSGGDAPGMNACIRAVVRTAIYHGIGVFGVIDGFNGLIQNNFKVLGYEDVSNILQRGGTILGTARSADFHLPEMRSIAHQHLLAHNIQALIVIGGDGSFKGASIFGQEFNYPVIGIPGTIDNDIVGTDYTIGFDTALNTIIEAVDKIRDTAASHHRVFLVEVMGNNSGILALSAAAASGAEEVFIPEREENMINFVEKIERALRAKKYSIIIVAEGDQVGGARQLYQFLEKQNLTERVRISVLGHIQRGGSPTFMDRLNATLLGEKAFVSLINGERDILIGIQKGQVVTCSIDVSQVKVSPKNLDYLNLIRKLNIY